MNLSAHTHLMLVSAALNDAFQAGIFDPERPNGGHGKERSSHTFHCGMRWVPLIAHFADWYRDEISYRVAAFPTKDAEQCIASSNAGARAGEIFVSGWIDREQGLRVQDWFDEKPHIEKRRISLIQSFEAPSILEDPLGLYELHRGHRL